VIQQNIKLKLCSVEVHKFTTHYMILTVLYPLKLNTRILVAEPTVRCSSLELVCVSIAFLIKHSQQSPICSKVFILFVSAMCYVSVV
jgi:hypothetical protein